MKIFLKNKLYGEWLKITNAKDNEITRKEFIKIAKMLIDDFEVKNK